MPPKISRSAIAKLNQMRYRRNFRPYHSSNVVEIDVGALFLTRGIGAALWCGLGYLIFGDPVSEYEEKRLEDMRATYGNSAEIEDLREKLLSNFPRKIVVSARNSLKHYTWDNEVIVDLREKMQPGLTEAEKVWSGLREKMLSGLREKIWSNRKS